MFFLPIPGSIRTVTTPALNNANTHDTNSQLGGIMRARRVPGVTPIACKPAASRVLSSASSLKVMHR